MMIEKNNIIILLISFIVLSNSIIYSALNTDMFIDGDAHIRIDKDIRIINLKVIDQTQGAYETYKGAFSKDTTSINITLPNSNSSIIYEITIKNTKDKDCIISDIKELTYSNNSIKYELIGLEDNQLIKANTTHTFQMKVTNLENNNNQSMIILKYDFILDEEMIWTFEYQALAQEFLVPYNGTYKIELWGASGANKKDSNDGGKGAYTSGEIKLVKNTKFYIYTGEKGINWSSNKTFGTYSFNGASGGSYACNGVYNHYGGGATDIRLIGENWDSDISLNSRIMVAAGGGAGGSLNSHGGAGGGITGYGDFCTTGATQTEGGGPSKGFFDKAGSPVYTGNICNGNDRYGGGSGYYRGGVNTNTSVGNAGANYWCGGAGGSSFISGHTGCVAITSEKDQTPKNGCITGTSDNNCSIHYSNKVFTNTKMIDGTGYTWTNEKKEYTEMPSHDGKSTIIGNTENGYDKITLLNINIE